VIDLDAIRQRYQAKGPAGLRYQPSDGQMFADVITLLAEVERLQAELKAMRYDRDWVVAEADDDVRARYFALKAAEEARRG
jgi:hypothetical protein